MIKQIILKVYRCRNLNICYAITGICSSHETVLLVFVELSPHVRRNRFIFNHSGSLFKNRHDFGLNKSVEIFFLSWKFSLMPNNDLDGLGLV